MSDPIHPAALQPVILAWMALLQPFQTIKAVVTAFQPLLTARDPEAAASIYTQQTLADLDLGEHLLRRLNPSLETPGADWRADLAHMEAVATSLQDTTKQFLAEISALDLPATNTAALHTAAPDLVQAVQGYHSQREPLG